jgi:hypothetical protein
MLREVPDVSAIVARELASETGAVMSEFTTLCTRSTGNHLSN